MSEIKATINFYYYGMQYWYVQYFKSIGIIMAKMPDLLDRSLCFVSIFFRQPMSRVQDTELCI